MEWSVFGLPALAMVVGFIVLLSTPVWMAARVVGAEQPTLLRAMGSLFLGCVGTVLGGLIGGPAALLLAPLAFLLAFKYVLGTSMVGALLLGLLALAAYILMGQLVGGGLFTQTSPAIGI